MGVFCYASSMPYKISAGIKESELEAWLKKAAKKYGPYQDKAVNYTNANTAPIVMCTVIYKDKILLAKRGYGLADAEGYWSTVNGFIDEVKPVQEIAQQECVEELSLKTPLSEIIVGTSYLLQNPAEKKNYIVFPCLVTITKKPEIILDREHTEFRWIDRKQLESYEILDDLPYAVDAALSLG